MQLRGITPPYPPPKNHDPPHHPVLHTRETAKIRESTSTVWPPPTHLQKSMHESPTTTLLLSPPLSFTKIFIAKAHNVKTRTHSLGNATQTHPPTSHPQPILVLHPLSPGRHTPSSRTHRRTQLSQPSPPSKGFATTSTLTTSLTSAHRTKFTSKVHTPVNTSAPHSARSSH